MVPTRLATPADYAACARLFAELEVPDVVFSEAQFVAQILPRVVVAVAGERVIGYASWRLYGLTAHVVHVAVDPEARGRGAGRALMDAVRAHVVGAGCARWYLNVKRANGSAIRLYERAGMTTDIETASLRLRWDSVAALPAPGPVEVFAPAPSDDAAIARRFELGAERVAFLRNRPGYVTAALREEGRIVGYAAFDPIYPGTYPFCAERPELARPLLAALRPHAREDRGDGVLVSVEGDALLAGALVAAGAEILFELYRMGASLS